MNIMYAKKCIERMKNSFLLKKSEIYDIYLYFNALQIYRNLEFSKNCTISKFVIAFMYDRTKKKYI